MKSIDQLKQAILDIIFDYYKKCYIGYLYISPLPEKGWDVGLGMFNDERPIHIAAQLDFDNYLKFFTQEIRNRHLSDTNFYTGYKSDIFDNPPYMPNPINHACHPHKHYHPAHTYAFIDRCPCIRKDGTYVYTITKDDYIFESNTCDKQKK